MKKVILSISMILAASALLLGFWACEWIIPPDGKGNLKVTVEYEPGESVIVDSYSYDLTGPQGQKVRRSGAGDVEIFEDIIEGHWKVEVDALDTDGYIVAQGSNAEIVKSDTTVYITVLLIEPSPTTSITTTSILTTTTSTSTSTSTTSSIQSIPVTVYAIDQENNITNMYCSETAITVSGGPIYQADDVVTLTALDSIGCGSGQYGETHEFVSWWDGKTENPRNITLKGGGLDVYYANYFSRYYH